MLSMSRKAMILMALMLAAATAATAATAFAAAGEMDREVHRKVIQGIHTTSDAQIKAKLRTLKVTVRRTAPTAAPAKIARR